MEIEFTSAGYVERLESENANLRDLLRRVRGCFRNGETPATIAIELSTLMPEIKAAIEPAGEATS